MAVERRTLWVGMALIAGVVVAAAVWTSGGSSGPPAPPARARAAQADGKTVAAGPPEHLNLDALKTERGQPVDSARNPFRFQQKALPPPVMQVPQPPSPANIAPPGPIVPQAPPGPPAPPPISLKFIALFTRPDGQKVAVLSDCRTKPQGGKEGDIILGQYVILKIGNESIEMAYVDGRGRQMIRLTGQC